MPVYNQPLCEYHHMLRNEVCSDDPNSTECSYQNLRIQEVCGNHDQAGDGEFFYSSSDSSIKKLMTIVGVALVLFIAYTQRDKLRDMLM